MHHVSYSYCVILAIILVVSIIIGQVGRVIGSNPNVDKIDRIIEIICYVISLSLGGLFLYLLLNR